MLGLRGLSLLFGILSLGLFGFSDAYAANANLFVSAENANFANYMSGPQVIEVVVLDSDIGDTDILHEEPDVTVNGYLLRMVQATDGNWYGYFADRDRAQIADSTSTLPGVGLDFGLFCDNTSNIGNANAPVYVTETEGIAVGSVVAGVNGSPFGGPISGASCSAATSGDTQNVLREEKDVSLFPNSTHAGQIGIDPDFWPFIQLYELNIGGNVQILYNTGAGVQSTTLTYDTVEHLAIAELDRDLYPQNSQVYATITDVWLNIDPTDEDSWTFQANEANPATMYRMFDKHGLAQGDAIIGGAIDIQPVMVDLLCDTNCILLLEPDQQVTGTDVVTIQDNRHTQITLSGDSESASSAKTSQITAGTYPITITETRTQSGIFTTFDDAEISTLRTTTDAHHYTSATLDYNEDEYSIVVNVVEPEPIFCDDLTIDELVSSGLYNVIDNRDGHLDGSRITGTNGDDLILASDAGNEIRSKKGNDCVIGGSGIDDIRGGNGDDQIFGLGGNDFLKGGKQNDSLYGGDGDDKVIGSGNDDQLFGELGNDILNGGSGNDAMSCGAGTDKANGGRGTDTATADCETIKRVP